MGRRMGGRLMSGRPGGSLAGTAGREPLSALHCLVLGLGLAVAGAHPMGAGHREALLSAVFCCCCVGGRSGEPGRLAVGPLPCRCLAQWYAALGAGPSNGL